MLRITLRSAYRRTERSLLVKPPSLNTGWVNRLVVTIGTTRPVSSSAARNRLMWSSRLGVVTAERDEVVVVEGDAVGAELGEPVHGLDRVERRAGRVAERVAGLPARPSTGRR